MKKEIEYVEGEIEIMRKDRKALKISNKWIQCFKEIPTNFQKGDLVKISFIENKGFLNLKSIEKVSKPLETKDFSDTVKNCIILTAKDIYLARKGEISLEEATRMVIESYQLI